MKYWKRLDEKGESEVRVAIVEDDSCFAGEVEKIIGDFFAAKREIVEIRRLESAMILEE